MLCTVATMSSVFRTSMATALLLCATFSPSCKDESPAEVAPPQTPSTVEAAPKTVRPLDPHFVPNEVLEGLEGMNLESSAPCSETLRTLKPVLNSIAEARAELAGATTEAEVIRLLGALSSDLNARLPLLAKRNETDELQRISAELVASVGDLAESLTLASEAIVAQDKEASSKVTMRLQNGVTNTRSSIERLIDQCAL